MLVQVVLMAWLAAFERPAPMVVALLPLLQFSASELVNFCENFIGEHLRPFRARLDIFHSLKLRNANMYSFLFVIAKIFTFLWYKDKFLKLFTSENVHTFTHDWRLTGFDFLRFSHWIFWDYKQTSLVTFSLILLLIEQKYFSKGSNFHHFLCRKRFLWNQKNCNFRF